MVYNLHLTERLFCVFFKNNQDAIFPEYARVTEYNSIGLKYRL